MANDWEEPRCAPARPGEPGVAPVPKETRAVLRKSKKSHKQWHDQPVRHIVKIFLCKAR